MRKLKADGAPEIDVKKAVNDLKARKKLLEDKELELTPTVCAFIQSGCIVRINDYICNIAGCLIRPLQNGRSAEASLFL